MQIEDQRCCSRDGGQLHYERSVNDSQYIRKSHANSTGSKGEKEVTGRSRISSPLDPGLNVKKYGVEVLMQACKTFFGSSASDSYLALNIPGKSRGILPSGLLNNDAAESEYGLTLDDLKTLPSPKIPSARTIGPSQRQLDGLASTSTKSSKVQSPVAIAATAVQNNGMHNIASAAGTELQENEKHASETLMAKLKLEHFDLKLADFRFVPPTDFRFVPPTALKLLVLSSTI